MNSVFSHGLRQLLSAALIFVFVAGPILAKESEAGSPAPVNPETTSSPQVSEDKVIAENVAQLHQAIADSSKRSVLDWARLLQTRLVKHPQPSRIRADNLTLEYLNGAGTSMGRLYQRVDYGQRAISLAASSFALSYQGDRVLEVAIKMESAVFHDGRLYFLESSRPDPQTGMLELSFIDLNYFASALGRTQIPIFRIPLKLQGSQFAVAREEGGVRVGSTLIPSEYLDHMAGLQQVAWNLNVTLVDPTALEAATETINDFGFYFDKGLGLAAEDVQRQVKRLGDFESFKDQTLATLRSELAEAKSASGMDADLKKALSEIASNHTQQQKLLARLGRLWGRVTLPQPMGAPSVVEGLKLISTGLTNSVDHPGVSDFVRVKEGVLRVLNTRAGKWTAAAVATAVFLYNGQDIAASGVDFAIGSAVNLGELLAKTTMNTMAGLNPMTSYHAYFTPEMFPKLMVGSTAAATVLFMSLGVPHLFVNTSMLVKDLAKAYRDRPTELSIWGRFKFVAESFVSRQKAQEEKFLKDLSSSAKKNASAADQADWLTLSADDQKALEALAESDRAAFRDQKRQEYAGQVREMIEADRSKHAHAWASRFARFAKQVNVFKFMSGSPETVFGALFHFVFSSASLTNSGHVYVKMWNAWFAFRSFVLSPVLAATFIYYPNYFSVMMKRDKGIDVPTYYNGGRRPFYEHEWLRLQQLFGGDHLKRLNAFEDAILPIERAVHEAVLKKSYSALLRRVEDPASLRKIFETNGIDNLADPTIKSLPSDMRAYFRAYYEKLFGASMERLLGEFLKSQGAYDTQEGAAGLKSAALGMEVDLKKFAATVNAESLVAETLKSHRSFDDEVRASWEASYHLRNMLLLDPTRNRQISRMQSVKRQAGNAQAMARAVRATRAAILVDKPLELVMMFVLLAGVTEGINVPLHTEMFSDDAWFYLGRYPFLTGYVTGVITSVLADIWMKLQQDEQNEGKFDTVPEGDDAKMSFKAYWFKKTFRNPDNTLWKNQMHYNKIIWANMRAALVMMLATNFLTLGRFDLDVYLMGYFFAYLIPTGGLAFKIEQGFELASSWHAKMFPAHLRTHPDAQRYLNDKLGSARIRFNMFYKLYENTLGVWMSNLMTIATQGLGPRALARLIFFGYTPTELVGNSLDWVGQRTSGIPGARTCANAMRSLVTNRYNSGIRLISKP